jgi:ferredoxin-NADP reductase
LTIDKPKEKNMNFETYITQIIQRTPDVKSFRFHKPAGMDCSAGQYMIVTIKSEGTELRKPFTISSSPTEQNFLEFTKKLTQHPFSKALEVLKPGDKVQIEAPFGNFIFKGEYGKIAMLAGGIGITPLRCMIKYATDNKLNTNIILLYSNILEDEIVFKNEIEEMKIQNENLKVAYTITQPTEKWNGLKGLINREMIQKVITDYIERVFYICGPPGMVDAMVVILKSLNIPEKQINKEQFVGD